MTQSGTSDQPAQHLVVMGVSGVGKTTVARQLALKLDYEFAEGDEFHPPANIEKMSAGVPLDDDDRLPWLRALSGWARGRHQEGTSTVMTCSALRRRYRDVLREGVPETRFVHLVGDQALLLERMSGRQHFMPPALLKSQFAALEPLEEDEAGLSVDVTEPPEAVVGRVVGLLDLD